MPTRPLVSCFVLNAMLVAVSTSRHSLSHSIYSEPIACDVIARFMRLSGRDVFFLSGTDEHGEKVEQSAEKQNMDPQGFVDQVSVNFRELLELMNISNDKFIRTTSEDHKKSVQVRFVE